VSVHLWSSLVQTSRASTSAASSFGLSRVCAASVCISIMIDFTGCGARVVIASEREVPGTRPAGCATTAAVGGGARRTAEVSRLRFSYYRACSAYCLVRARWSSDPGCKGVERRYVEAARSAEMFDLSTFHLRRNNSCSISLHWRTCTKIMHQYC